MIYDVVTYNGERELLDLRLNVLEPFVDQFIVVEFHETFSGKPKSLRYPPDLRRFTKFFKKLSYFAIPKSVYAEYLPMAQRSLPETTVPHFYREFCQKESIKWTLASLRDEDVVYIGDVDEIVDPSYYHENFQGIQKFKLLVYTYWLNNRSNEEFWGPIRAHWVDLKDDCLNRARTDQNNRTPYTAGWHFTSMGGYHSVREKLTDSYTEDSYASASVLSALKDVMHQNKDFIGRDFTYWTDESAWPTYLKDHRVKYEHLCH